MNSFRLKWENLVNTLVPVSINLEVCGLIHGFYHVCLFVCFLLTYRVKMDDAAFLEPQEHVDHKAKLVQQVTKDQSVLMEPRYALSLLRT